MKVTIHQPEHFPYMGFFQKMREADLFIILDNVKFRKNYFQNRNKILSKAGKDEWFTVPVEKKSSSKMIKDVMTNTNFDWRRKLLLKLNQNLNVDLQQIYEPDKLIDINVRSIEWCRKKFDIDVPMVYASDLNVEGSKSELLANLVRAVGADHYISGPSGRDYLDMNFFNNIEVSFFEPRVKNYYSSLYNIAKSK